MNHFSTSESVLTGIEIETGLGWSNDPDLRLHFREANTEKSESLAN